MPVNDDLELLVVGRSQNNTKYTAQYITGVEKVEPAILIFVIFHAALNHIRSL